MLQLMTGQDKGTVVPFVEQACNDAQQDPGRFAEVSCDLEFLACAYHGHEHSAGCLKG